MSKTLSVLELNEYVNSVLSRQPLLQNLKVCGEVSNIHLHSSGHVYFTLKGETAAVKCVMFRSAVSSLSYLPSEGQSVTVSGYVQIYIRDGQYQLYVNEMELSGEGELYGRYLALKNELGKLGFFDEEIKKQIPQFVKKIGVVTSPTGAVIRDIINVATRRNPSIGILLYPVKVQGVGAAQEIAYAVDRLNNYDVDVIIVGRGGGSIEDLWAFNERVVAEAIFRSSKPVISAVGHQTDFTIADFVADLRAPTPSAAAEQATVDVVQILKGLNSTQKKLDDIASRAVKDAKKQLSSIFGSYTIRNPERLIVGMVQNLDNQRMRLENSFSKTLGDAKNKLKLLSAGLSALSPEAALNRGYAIITDKNGDILNDVTKMNSGEDISIRMKSGIRSALVR